MFFCQACFLDQPTSGESEDEMKLSVLSDEGNKEEINTILFKKSLFDKYVKKYEKKPFTDPEFPPDNTSLQYQIPGRTILWKRISQIIPNYVIFEGTIEKTDVQSLNIGDQYFLPTIAAIAKHPNRIKTIFHLVPLQQKSTIFRLLVKQSGVIKELVIDDYVPVFSDSGRPVFCKANGREVWTMLLQKAWAKLKGSYSAILTGCPHEVLSTFCIGPCRTFNLPIDSAQSKQKLWKNLRKAYQNHYIVCAASAKQPISKKLASRHIYKILSAGEQNGTRIIKLSNYWDETIPSKELVQDKSKHMQSIVFSPSYKLPSPKKNQQGELLLPFNEFLHDFDRLDISNENGSFNYEFMQIQISPMEPIFMEFQVQEEHEAFIAVYKPYTFSYNEKYGHIRMILAHHNNSGELQFQFEKAVQQTQFPDTFIHILHFSIGKHVLFINSNFPNKQQKLSLTLGYSSKNIGKGSRTLILPMKDVKNLYSNFINSAFLSHSYKAKDSNNLKKQDDLFQCIDLFEQCGYGYVSCSVSSKSNIKLHITIDSEKIKQSGIKLLGKWKEKEIIEPGGRKIFIFELLSQHLEVEFPPKGFSITKVI